MDKRDKFRPILSNNETDWLDYKITRSEVNMELRIAKKEYYSSNIALKTLIPKKPGKNRQYFR